MRCALRGALVTLVLCPQQNENHGVNKAAVMKTCLAKVIDTGQTEMIDISANQFPQSITTWNMDQHVIRGHQTTEPGSQMAWKSFVNLKLSKVAQTCNFSNLGVEAGGLGV